MIRTREGENAYSRQCVKHKRVPLLVFVTLVEKKWPIHHKKDYGENAYRSQQPDQSGPLPRNKSQFSQLHRR